MWKSVGVPGRENQKGRKHKPKLKQRPMHVFSQSGGRGSEMVTILQRTGVFDGQTVALCQASPVFSLRHTKCVTCMRNWCQAVSTRFLCFPKKSMEMSTCRFFLSCSSFRDLIMPHSTEVPVVCLRIPSSIQKLHMFLQHGIMVFSSVSPFRFDF